MKTPALVDRRVPFDFGLRGDCMSNSPPPPANVKCMQCHRLPIAGTGSQDSEGCYCLASPGDYPLERGMGVRVSDGPLGTYQSPRLSFLVSELRSSQQTAHIPFALSCYVTVIGGLRREGGMENTMTDKNESVTASGAPCRFTLAPETPARRSCRKDKNDHVHPISKPLSARAK